MNTNTVKGTMNNAAGRAKRQVGEWTGDSNVQMEGAAQQVKGKAQKAWGAVQDAVKDMKKGARDAKSSATRKFDSVKHKQRGIAVRP